MASINVSKPDVPMVSQNVPSQYYFAFGSNMCLAQMAERCPGSCYIGKAVLRGYRWQINQRHVANIVRADDGDNATVVEGLVFSITEQDRRTLDRKEGIRLGVYERVQVVVYLTRDHVHAAKKTDFVRARLEDGHAGGSTSVSRDQQQVIKGPSPPGPAPKLQYQQQPSHSPQSLPPLPRKQLPPGFRKSEGKPTKAITYLSTRFCEVGFIRKEYVKRMEDAMSDGIKLGISPCYFDSCVKPFVHREISPPHQGKMNVNEETKDPAARGPDVHPANRLEQQQMRRQPPQESRVITPERRAHGPGSKKPPPPVGKATRNGDGRKISQSERKPPSNGQGIDLWKLGTSVATSVFGSATGRAQTAGKANRAHEGPRPPKL
jgi:hypothetical protein